MTECGTTTSVQIVRHRWLIERNANEADTLTCRKDGTREAADCYGCGVRIPLYLIGWFESNADDLHAAGDEIVHDAASIDHHTPLV